MNVVLAVVWLAACGVIAAIAAPAHPSFGFKDSTAVLAFIGVVAVSIERGIEGFFAIMAGRLGQWWPLRVMRDEFDEFERQTNQVLGPVTTRTREELAAARERFKDDEQKVLQIQGLLDQVDAMHKRLNDQLTDATTKLVPGSARLARVGEIGAAMSATLHQVHAAAAADTRTAQELLRDAGTAADRASMIIASFQDNPARRLASLVIGAGLGMLVAGGVGLNVFVATLGAPTDPGAMVPAVVAGWFGVVLTGILIGMGSAPTHEVVKSLQAYKDNRAGPVALATIAPGTGINAAITGAGGDGVIAEGFMEESPGAAVVLGQGLAAPAQLNVRRVRSTS